MSQDHTGTNLPDQSSPESTRPSQDLVGQKVITEIIRKIRHEPLLFLLGVLVLLVGLATAGTGLASSDFRFLVVVIALLCFVGIIAYYISEAYRDRGRQQAPGKRPPEDHRIVTASGDGSVATGGSANHATIITGVQRQEHAPERQPGESPSQDTRPKSSEPDTADRSVSASGAGAIGVGGSANNSWLSTNNSDRPANPVSDLKGEKDNGQ